MKTIEIKLPTVLSNRPKNLQGGFSLAEVMIVIAILAVLSAIAIPNIIRYRDNAQLRSSAMELIGIFRKAQTFAVKNHQNTTLNITASAITILDSGGNTVDTVQANPGTTFQNNFANIPGYTPRGLPLEIAAVPVLGSVEVRPTSNSNIRYMVSLSRAGHTKLRTSTNSGSSWK